MKTLDAAAWTDFDARPVTLGFHSRAIATQARALDRLRVPFPAFSVLDERASYIAHRDQSLKVIDAAVDLIIDQMEILNDMAEERTDRKGIRELLMETVEVQCLSDADDYYSAEGE